MSFVHLHVHTEYSLLDGSNKIKEYVARVKELGMNAAAITDHGVMYGVIEFYKAAKEAGINPIIGCEIYVAPGSRFDREYSHGDDRYYHLVLLAENDLGYANLMKIVSKGFIDGYYYKPRVDMEVLQTYHEGIIATSACLAGVVQQKLARGDYEGAREEALKYENCFGKGNFFLELQDHGIPKQREVNPQLIRLSRETGIGLVATNDVHYTYAEDAEAHDILLCIQTNKKLADTDRMRYEGGQYYVKSEEQMRELFPNVLEALENTQRIADRCHVEIEFGVTKLPHFEVPKGHDSWSYLNKLCFEGLAKRYPGKEEELRPRLQEELDTIQKMGYVDYFLIVWDYIRYAREHDIMVGPGRGSAAGSLVAYTTGITDIDPIRYSLIFERFLNPERVSMPDIDVDFCYERRQEVIDYVIEKYGTECVTQIITFGTLKAKGVIRDVGRVMDLPYAFVDGIAKAIPNILDITIDKAMEMNQDLRGSYQEDETVRKLIDLCKRLEGLPRHASVHAAGVVISQKPMEEYVPLAKGADQVITTQYEKNTIEELGLLKMDFLGLRTLTVIQDASRLIARATGKEPDFEKLGYEDEKVFEYIGTGRTDGVFQLESAGMKSFMKELRPKNLEDVIAGISLYRPGPMDFIPAYIKGKDHPETIRYDCSLLEPILKPTYGCIVYQEQVMQIVRDLAGYTWGRSDIVRRTMSKKKVKDMEKERKNFVYGDESQRIKGCIANGIPEGVANKIYDEMIDFAKYAFNKSHAAAYAVVTYQTAWLKYYYPVEYMAALMTSVMDNTNKISEYIQTCRKMNIPILPPDVNEGEGGFSVQDGKIRYGMSAIKSVGRSSINTLIKEREQNGRYRSLEDFAERLVGKDLNKRAVENLIKAGALDGVSGNRRQKIMIYQKVMDNVAHEKKNSMSGQLSLFDFVSEEDKKDFEIQLPQVPEFEKEMLLGFEKAVLGVYVSGHPLEEYVGKIEKNVTAYTTDFIRDGEADEGRMRDQGGGGPKVKDGQVVTVGGMVQEIKLIYTKNNTQMAYVTLEDLVGSMEIVVFPKSLETYKNVLKEEARIFVTGRVNVEEEKDARLNLMSLYTFDEVPRILWLRFHNEQDYRRKEREVLGLAFDKRVQTRGAKDEIRIYLEDGKQFKSLGERMRFCVDETLIEQFSRVLGKNNVKVTEKNLANVNKRY